MAQVMQDQASGMTVGRLTLAELLDTTPSSSVFRQLVASSRFYGLTEGGINASDFFLTDLGGRATSPDDAVRVPALKEAVMQVAPFAAFFNTFSNRKIPAPGPFRDYLTKTAGVDAAHVDDCMAHILDDAAVAGLTRSISGALWVDLDGVPTDPGGAGDGDGPEVPDPAVAVATNGGPPPPAADVPDEAPPAPAPAPAEPEIPQAMFVAGRKGSTS